MKTNRFFPILVIAAGIAAAAALALHRGEKASWQEQALPAGTALFPDLPVNDVAVVAIAGPGGKVTLRRGGDGWTVDERAAYAADASKVSRLVLKMAGLKAVQSFPVDEAGRAELGLQQGMEDRQKSDAGTTVTLADAQGATLGRLTLGKLHYTSQPGVPPQIGGSATGRYVVSEANPSAALVVTESFADVVPSPAAWIDASFVRPGFARRLDVKASGQDCSWIMERDAPGAPWKLDGAKKNQAVDSSRLLSLDSLLGGMSAADVPDGPEDVRLKPLVENPVTVTADTFDGIRYVLTIGEGNADNLPVRVSVEASPADNPAEPVKADDASAKQRDSVLAAAKKFDGRVVFVPRNFLQPFFATKSSLLAPAAPPR